MISGLWTETVGKPMHGASQPAQMVPGPSSGQSQIQTPLVSCMMPGTYVSRLQCLEVSANYGTLGNANIEAAQLLQRGVRYVFYITYAAGAPRPSQKLKRCNI